MAFPVFMTFSKTINNSELAPNLADLLEGPSIGQERAISAPKCAAPLHAGLCQPNLAERGSIGRLLTIEANESAPRATSRGGVTKDKTKGGSYAYRIRATYLAKR
jgi:hypothetical protein